MEANHLLIEDSLANSEVSFDVLRSDRILKPSFEECSLLSSSAVKVVLLDHYCPACRAYVCITGSPFSIIQRSSDLPVIL